MTMFVSACDTVRRQEAKIDVQCRKLEGLKALVLAQEHRIEIAERKKRHLEKLRWDRELMLGFTKAEKKITTRA
jgi:hypothetical protein